MVTERGYPPRHKGNDKRAPCARGEWSEKERFLRWGGRGMKRERARSQTKPPTVARP